jgi:CYTH domain-containing protein/predicted ATPase
MLKIVLTGGPCGGKSSALSKLTQILEERSYKVFTVWESATPLILNGIKPSKQISMTEFQKFILDEQIASEKIFDQAVTYYDPDKVIIFYDRGIMDGAAYVDKETTFKSLLASRGLTFAEAYNRYDAVLHLVTAADGAEKYYQWNNPDDINVGNNAARSESPEEAIKKDIATLNAWIGHPHLRVFDNSTDFKGKVDRIIKEVFALLGEPVPSEIERKYLIRKPTEEQIKNLGCISKTNIIQTYLKRDNDNIAERRVRQRGTKEDGFSFYYTEKTDVATGVRVEKEKKITSEEYLQLLTEADTSLHQISKTRYCFMYERQYFEMDIYPFSNEYAIVEIELNDINQNVKLPPLDFIKDVTDDSKYRNYTLAKTATLN